MKRLFPALAAPPIAALMLSALLAACGDPSDIGNRSGQKGLSLLLEGRGSAVNLGLKVENSLKRSLDIHIPAGAVFHSLRDPEKRMLVLGELSFSCPPGPSEFSVPVFSLQHFRSSADAGEGFDPAGYEKIKTKGTRQLMRWLASKEGQAQVRLDDAASSSPLQQAVWNLEGGLVYEEDLDYKIDSVILNYLLGNQPESVVVLIPDALSLSSEEDLARAVARLLASPPLLKERLQAANPMEYVSSALHLRELYEETGSLDFRARVNEILTAAGLPAGY